MRGRGKRALLLPLAAFLLVFFVAPLAWLLSLAVREAEVPRALPRTRVALGAWQATQAVPGAAYAAQKQDLVVARAAGTRADAA
ncbi:MAG: ABC transporter permease, partial [Burkholderiales bacterium]